MRLEKYRNAFLWVIAFALCPLVLSSCLVSTSNSLSGDEAYLGGEPYKIVLASNGCFSCHSPWAQFSTQAEWIAALGSEIIPGNGTGSDFYQRIIGGPGVSRMPPTGSLIPDGQAETIRAWINSMTP